MLVQIKLVDGAREMILRPRDGIAHTSLDAGFPEIREVTSARTDDDGTDDTTARFGASAVSIALRLYEHGGTRAILDELTRFCHPGRRPYLVVTDDEWDQVRRIRLRADQVSAPIEVGRGYVRDVSVSWKAPDGAWEATTAETVTVVADLPSTIGFSLPLVFPLELEATLSSGAVDVTNVGAIPCHWVGRLYGPCKAPRLINTVTGQELTFSESLVLGPGDYVEVSTRDRTAYLLSDTTLSRLGFLDFSISTWWQLQPGVQQLRYAPVEPSAGSQAELTFYPRWL